ncbi:uncharacterized protein LOC117124642, partial [Anneissia japonica]|uniref:uncharacterized protein LOC117124642 n=1 Tax=Anneissia japonica TaxID=1529436 RepID=UPI001425862D
KAAEIYDSGVAHIVTRKLLDGGKESPTAESTNNEADSENMQTSSKKETRREDSESSVKDEKKSKSVKQLISLFNKSEVQSPTNDVKEVVTLEKEHVAEHVEKDHVPEQVQKKIEDKLEKTVKKKETLGKWHRAQEGTFNILDFGGQLIYKGIQR